METENVEIQTPPPPMRPSDYGTPEHNVPALAYAALVTFGLCALVAYLAGVL